MYLIDLTTKLTIRTSASFQCKIIAFPLYIWGICTVTFPTRHLKIHLKRNAHIHVDLAAAINTFKHQGTDVLPKSRWPSNMAASISLNPSALTASGTNRQLSSPSARSLHTARERPAYPSTHRTTCHSCHTRLTPTLKISLTFCQTTACWGLCSLAWLDNNLRFFFFFLSHSVWESNN